MQILSGDSFEAQTHPLCRLDGCDRPCYAAQSFCGPTCGQQFSQSFTLSPLPPQSLSPPPSPSQTQSQSPYPSPPPTPTLTDHDTPDHSPAQPEGTPEGSPQPPSPYSLPAVEFYERDKPFYEFTNFYEPREGIIIDGKRWRTTEAYFQACKFPESSLFDAVRQLRTPREAWNFARTNQKHVRADWFDVSMRVMYKAVFCKFSQVPALQALLLSTGNRLLIEHTANDSHWGDGGDGSGHNHLGRVLMRVRDELAQTTPSEQQ